jgi:type IV pilus assembly protein PilN
MYNLDINFLNDRPEYATATGARGGSSGGRRGGGGGRALSGGGGTESKTPFYAGLGALVALSFLSLGFWGFQFLRNTQLKSRQSELAAQVTDLEAKQKELDGVQAQLKGAKDEITALTSVFSNIKPWSAMSQDMRDRLPSNVQIASVTQAEALPATATPTTAQVASGKPAPPPAPVGVIKILGEASTHNDVNDFLVVLQKSNFLKPESTRIVLSELQPPQALGQLSIPGSNAGGGQPLPKLPPRVKFEIETALTDVPTSDLMRELDRKGAVGLVSRIEALKEKGVIKP